MQTNLNTGSVTIALADEQGDTPGQPGSACQNGATQIGLEGVNSADGNGNVAGAFDWPIDAATTGHAYWVCGKQGGVTSAGVSKFTVLGPNPPSVHLDVSQAAPGSHISVAGYNWLPGGIHVSVLLAPYIDSSPPFYTLAQVTSQPDGSFSSVLQVPPDAPVGTTLYLNRSPA
jgi:hypothetical protein